MVKVIATCMNCHVKYELELKEEDYIKWRSGTLIQNAFPYLSDDDRELLISEICGKCFDKLFPEE